MRKLYFEAEDSEICYTEDYFLNEIEPGEEIEVYEAIKYKPEDRIPGVFWCQVHEFCGDNTADSCGKQCKEYEPRNGVSGCCRHHTTALYSPGEKVTFKKEK